MKRQLYYEQCMRVTTGLFSVVFVLVVLAGSAAYAAVVVSYDPSLGTFPDSQGFSAFEIDTDGVLGDPVDISNPANAALEVVDAMDVLHMRDNISDGSFNLPMYLLDISSYQQAMFDNGFDLTLVYQSNSTSSGTNGLLRMGLSSAFHAADNIDSDKVSLNIQDLSLVAGTGTLHSILVQGSPNGSNYDFTVSIDGEDPVPLESLGIGLTGVTTVGAVGGSGNLNIGATSSGGQGTDLLIKSFTLEFVPEPSSATLGLIAIFGMIGRRQHRRLAESD